jgi:hypothetical protein
MHAAGEDLRNAYRAGATKPSWAAVVKRIIENRIANDAIIIERYKRISIETKDSRKLSTATYQFG